MLLATSLYSLVAYTWAYIICPNFDYPLPVNFVVISVGWFIAFNVLYNHFMCATTNAGKPPSHKEYAAMRCEPVPA